MSTSISQSTGLMISLAIVDSGPLIAAVNRSDPAHRVSAEILRSAEFYLVIPALCVAEAAYIIERDAGTQFEAMFLEGLATLDVRLPEPEDWPRIASLVRRYANFPLGGTDASIVALAERLNTDTIITLDRRHFASIQPAHCESFRLLPA